MMYVVDGVLELSTGSGAAIAGRTMLAVRRKCLICIFAMVIKGRFVKAR